MSLVSERAQAVRRLLGDSVIQEVFVQLHEDAYRAFTTATTDAQLRDAHAFHRAVDALEVALQAVQDAEERERLDEQSAERQAATR